jgi:protein-tyrosine phosphatase
VGERFLKMPGNGDADMIRRESLERLRKILDSKRHINILVLCHGNICRSPLAEHCLKQSLPAERFSIRSAGVIPRVLRQSPREYARLAKKEGVDLSEHRSSLVKEEDLSWADLVVIMDWKNHQELLDFSPNALEKTVRLGVWSNTLDIPDPSGLSEPEILRIIDQMKQACQSFSRDVLR